LQFLRNIPFLKAIINPHLALAKTALLLDTNSVLRWYKDLSLQWHFHCLQTGEFTLKIP